MIKFSRIYCAVAVLLIIFSGEAIAIDIYNLADQSTVRCSGGIVAVGDSERIVEEKCGDPRDVQKLQDVGIIWIYQIGLSKFLYYLAFRNGNLERIVSAPCSVNDPECFDLR